MKKRILTGLLPFLCVLFVSCSGSAVAQSKSSEVKKQFFAMDTIMELTAYGENAKEALAAAQAEIERLEALFSTTVETSEVYQINQSGGEPVAVSAETARLIRAAIEIAEKTDGLSDLTVYPVIEAWGFISGEYTIPDSGALAALLAQVDYRKIMLAENAVSLPAGMEIDLGSIAKGYAADRAADALKEAGAASGIVSLGGDVRTLGLKEDGSEWRIAVQSPFGEGYLGVVTIGEGSIVTSGDYERFFEGEDGARYHHIIDTRTGAPAVSDLVSVSVVSNTSEYGDAMSTPLFVMGLEDAAAHWRSAGDFEAIFVCKDKSVYITQGLEEKYEHMMEGTYQVLFR